MDEEKVTINSAGLAILIRNELIKLGVRSSNDMNYKTYTKSELEQIKRLKIIQENVGDISQLKYLKNLKQLEIMSANIEDQESNNMTWQDVEENYNMKSSGIKDFSSIGSLENLEYLSIHNEKDLTDLDLTNNKNLVHLEVARCPNLLHINGLESVKQLNEIKLLNNSKYKDTFDLPQIIEKGAGMVEIDVDKYPDLIKKYKDLPKIIFNQRINGLTMKWIENVSNTDENVISAQMMEKMHEKTEEILEKIIAPDYTDVEKITAIYEYITSNVKYDHDALNASNNPDLLNSFIERRGNLGEAVEKTLLKRQSSFNAIMENTAVCEGYSNMMHYMLKCCDIESESISCSSIAGKEGVTQGRNHGVVRVHLGDDYYYFDPTWDAGKDVFKNFFKTKTEFNQTHSLTLTDKYINDPKQKIKSNAELTQIRKKVIEDYESGVNINKNRKEKEKMKTEKEKESCSFLDDLKKNTYSQREQIENIKKQLDDDFERGLFEEDKKKSVDEKSEKTDDDFIW